jgi:hypothetical protein
MNLSENHWTDFALKVLGAFLMFFTLRWIANIFKGKDGKFDQHELRKFTAFIIAISAFVYIILKEGERPSGTPHIFSDLWVITIVVFLLGVLHMDYLIDSINHLLRTLVELKTKKTDVKTTVSVEEEITNQ